MVVLLKHLDGGKYALGFFNMDEQDGEIPATLANFGLTASSGLDLLANDVLGDGEARTYREYMRVPVPAHDCRVFVCELVPR